MLMICLFLIYKIDKYICLFGCVYLSAYDGDQDMEKS